MSSDQHSIVEIIGRKRDGGRLTAEELHWIIAAYTRGDIPDYQLSALLMAILFRRLDPGELASWTEAMLHSGDVLDLGHLSAPKVDKHSTGGVGDKVSIALAPIVAACGLIVPMISGRGLGHTGGTLDKLESIPGFRTSLAPDEFLSVVEQHGMVFAGQSEALVPADRLIYALRDTTGTVPSLSLIASSIMSKKLAEDIDALILDVKVGSGAFMKNIEDARELAETMVGIGAAHQTNVVAVFTAMDQPLGREVGNGSEIAESIDILKGNGPPDLIEVIFKIGAEMLVAGGIIGDLQSGVAQMRDVIASGEAIDRFAAIIEAQGGNPEVLSDASLLPTAPHVFHVRAPGDGFVVKCEALDIGVASVRLGGGRERKGDEIDPGVGITVAKKLGERVEEGDVLAEVRYTDPARLAAAEPLLEQAWEISDEPPEAVQLLRGEVRQATATRRG